MKQVRMSTALLSTPVGTQDSSTWAQSGFAGERPGRGGVLLPLEGGSCVPGRTSSTRKLMHVSLIAGGGRSCGGSQITSDQAAGSKDATVAPLSPG